MYAIIICYTKYYLKQSNMKNRYLSLSLCVFMSITAMAQQSGNGSVKGTVVESTTKNAIGFASVAISANGEIISGDLTEEDGSFSINNLPNKEIEISVEYIGFKTYKYSVNLSVEKTVDLGIIALETDEEVLETLEIGRASCRERV